MTEPDYLDTVLKVKEACGSVEHVVDVTGSGREGTLSLEEVEARADDDFDFEAAWRAVEPDDVLTLIYTSGTTGPPKGVQITHANELARGPLVRPDHRVPRGARVVSYLPMAHIAERSCSQYLPIMFGFTVTDCPNAREVVGYLPEVHPTWFFSVPRIFEKLKAAIEAGDRSTRRTSRSSRPPSGRSTSGCARCAPSRPGRRCPTTCGRSTRRPTRPCSRRSASGSGSTSSRR